MTRRRALRAGRLGRRTRSGDSITGSESPARSSGPPVLRTRSGPLVLDRVALVGILNATPDSFSDGGRHLDPGRAAAAAAENEDRKSTRLNSSHPSISYAVFCLKKKKKTPTIRARSPADET